MDEDRGQGTHERIDDLLSYAEPGLAGVASDERSASNGLGAGHGDGTMDDVESGRRGQPRVGAAGAPGSARGAEGTGYLDHAQAEIERALDHDRDHDRDHGH